MYDLLTEICSINSYDEGIVYEVNAILFMEFS